MSRFGDRIPVAAEQLPDLVEEAPASRRDPGHIFKQNQFRQMIDKRFEHEPNAPQGEPVECLIFGGLAEVFRKQA